MDTTPHQRRTPRRRPRRADRRRRQHHHDRGLAEPAADLRVVPPLLAEQPTAPRRPRRRGTRRLVPHLEADPRHRRPALPHPQGRDRAARLRPDPRASSASSTRTPASCDPPPSSASSSSPSSTKANSPRRPTFPPSPSCSPARTRHPSSGTRSPSRSPPPASPSQRGPLDGPAGAEGRHQLPREDRHRPRRPRPGTVAQDPDPRTRPRPHARRRRSSERMTCPRPDRGRGRVRRLRRVRHPRRRRRRVLDPVRRQLGRRRRPTRPRHRPPGPRHRPHDRRRARERTRRRPPPQPDRRRDQRQPAARGRTAAPSRLAVGVGTTDQIIADHLATGPFNWQRLAASIPALEPDRAVGLDDRPDGQAIVLAEAGASAEANVLVLRTPGGRTTSQSQQCSLCQCRIASGSSPALYSSEEICRGIRQSSCCQARSRNAIYADLLVEQAGRHPAAVRRLPSPVALRQRRRSCRRAGFDDGRWTSWRTRRLAVTRSSTTGRVPKLRSPLGLGWTEAPNHHPNPLHEGGRPGSEPCC